MWTSSVYLGMFVGPTVAGVLVENYGFPFTTMIFFVLYVLDVFIDSFELFYNVFIKKKKMHNGYQAMS